ncbi:hypothetical protein Tco_0808886, partial [Tanacetum coccineum]
DTIAVKNVTSAQDLMTELRVLLEQEAAYTEPTKAYIGPSLISRQNYVDVQIERRKAKVLLFCPKLEEIEELLEKLPASKRAKDLVATGAIRVLHVPSRYQYADIFTKGLPTSLFDEFRTSLSVRSSPVQTAGEC